MLLCSTEALQLQASSPRAPTTTALCTLRGASIVLILLRRLWVCGGIQCATSTPPIPTCPSKCLCTPANILHTPSNIPCTPSNILHTPQLWWLWYWHYPCPRWSWSAHSLWWPCRLLASQCLALLSAVRSIQGMQTLQSTCECGEIVVWGCKVRLALENTRAS